MLAYSWRSSGVEEGLAPLHHSLLQKTVGGTLSYSSESVYEYSRDVGKNTIWYGGDPTNTGWEFLGIISQHLKLKLNNQGNPVLWLEIYHSFPWRISTEPRKPLHFLIWLGVATGAALLMDVFGPDEETEFWVVTILVAVTIYVAVLIDNKGSRWVIKKNKPTLQN